MIMQQTNHEQQSQIILSGSCRKQTLKQQQNQTNIDDKQQPISPEIILSNNTQKSYNENNKYPHDDANSRQQQPNNNKQNSKHKFVKSIMTEQPCTINQSQQKHKTKIINKKPQNHTFRTNYIKSIHNSNELILVYLMYKDQKLSLFLNKGVSFDELSRRMYKQIYIYEKQTYSISNAILKNLLYKITGFQSIDNDLYYDYQLKYRRGNLNRQKFFVPFKQEDLKMPFKIYTKLSTSKFYGNQQYLARNYSDGEWAILTAIKKANFDQEKLNIIKKSLKINFSSCSLLLKHSPSYFSQFNWFETKHHLIIASQYFPQNLQQNLIKNKQKYDLEQSAQIFKFYAKWLAYLLKIMVQNNAQIFKKIKLRQIGLNAFDGYPKLNVLQNVISCIDFGQRRRSVIQNGRRVSQKINDKFYQETYICLIENLVSLFKDKLSDSLDQVGQQKDSPAQKMTDQFQPTTNSQSQQPHNPLLLYMNTIQQISKSQNFNFQQILKNQLFSDMNVTCNISKRQKHPLEVDFDSKIKNIVQSMNRVKISSSQPATSTLQISQLKDQIQRTFSLQAIRRNQQRNQNKTIIQLLSTSINGLDLSKQNIYNLTQFKKQQQRKYQIKNKQKLYVQQIINQLNQNQNFIKTTKQNNLASIQFYLKKSDEKIKRKMISKIQTKYKKFFQKKQQTKFFQQEEFLEGKDFMQQGKNTNTYCFEQKNKPVCERNSTINSLNNGQIGHDEKEQQDQIKQNRKKNNSLQPLLFKKNLKILNCKVQNSRLGIKKSKSTLKTNFSLICEQDIKRTQRHEQRTSAPKQASNLMNRKPDTSSTLLFKQKSNIPTTLSNSKADKNTLFAQKYPKYVLSKQKSPNNLTSSLKKSRLQQFFVNSRDYLKDEKMQLKKKQYGIYLQQAQKQYNKIKVYKKNKNEQLQNKG